MTSLRPSGRAAAAIAAATICLSACGGTTVKTRTIIRTVTDDVAATVTETVRLPPSTVPPTASAQTDTTGQLASFDGSATQRGLSARCLKAPPAVFATSGRVTRQEALATLPRVVAIENDVVYAATRPKVKASSYFNELDQLASAIDGVQQLLQQALNTHNQVSAAIVTHAADVAVAESGALGLKSCAVD